MFAVVFVVYENGSGVEVPNAFGFVVIIVDAVEGQSGEEMSVSCECFVFMSEFFATVAVVRIMIDHLVSWCVSLFFVLRAC
jgi:hypothetical protein